MINNINHLYNSNKDLAFIKFSLNSFLEELSKTTPEAADISEISAASGVVLDSAARKEFNENFIKAKSLLELYK